MFNALINNQMFGIMLTTLIYILAVKLFVLSKSSIINPILISIVAIIAVLKIFNIPYETYNIGGSIFTTLITPATVALAIPLHKNLHLLKKHFKSILTGIIVGNTLNCVLVGYVCKLFAYKPEIIASFMPKSVTTAIAVGLAKNINGIESITIILVIVTGITGATLGPSIYKMLNVDDKVAIGVSLGSASHAVGTSKAIEMDKEIGAMAGLSIGLTGLYVILIAPLILIYLNVL